MGGVAVHPQIVHRIVYVPWLKMWHLPHESAGRHYLVDDELRLIGGEIQTPFFSDLVHDGVEHLIGKFQSLIFTFLLKYALV